MTIRISIDTSDLSRELARLSATPSGIDKAQLDRVLDTAFGITQANVHVDTGHLKATGETSSREDGGEWVGEISYGQAGDARWKRDPEATYAVFEQRRGGSHDFFNGLDMLEAMFEAAVRDIL